MYPLRCTRIRSEEMQRSLLPSETNFTQDKECLSVKKNEFELICPVPLPIVQEQHIFSYVTSLACVHKDNFPDDGNVILISLTPLQSSSA